MAKLVAHEFFEQGDIERQELNLEPIDMMNREKLDSLPKMQVKYSVNVPIESRDVKIILINLYC